MKIFKFFGLMIFIASLSIIAKAQADTSYSFSLKEAQNYAIENFFVSKNAQLDIKSAQKKIWETTAIGLPQVSANGEYQRYLDDSIPSMPFPDFANWNGQGQIPMSDLAIFTRDNFSYGANISQLIFSGEYIVGLQASRVYKLLSEENYEKVKIDLRESVAGSYYAVLILEENQRVIQETLKNLYKNLEESRKTFAVGLIEDVDVDQLDLTVKRTENDLRSIENQLKTMDRMLKYQMGLSNEIQIELRDSLDELISQNIISDSDYIFNLDEHIDYRMLETNENLQELSLNREKSLLLPTVSGYYNYTGITNTTAFTPPHNLIGVRANWTIFQSGMRNAKIAQAKIALEQVRNIKEQEAERLIISAQQAKFDYLTALTRYHNEVINFDLSRKVFDNTTTKFDEGIVSSLELSLVNNQYLGAQLSYAMAVQDLLSKKVALDKAYSKL